MKRNIFYSLNSKSKVPRFKTKLLQQDIHFLRLVKQKKKKKEKNVCANNRRRRRSPSTCGGITLDCSVSRLDDYLSS